MAVVDRLVFACKEDTAVLTSLRGWLHEERAKVVERLSRAEKWDDVLKLQGAAAKLNELAELIAQWSKTK